MLMTRVNVHPTSVAVQINSKRCSQTLQLQKSLFGGAVTKNGIRGWMEEEGEGNLQCPAVDIGRLLARTVHALDRLRPRVGNEETHLVTLVRLELQSFAHFRQVHCE